MRALRGLMRLKTLVQGNLAKQQASNTLRCMQTLSRVQSQIRERRIRMFEENRAIQWQLQKKHEKEVNKLQAAVNCLSIFAFCNADYGALCVIPHKCAL